MDTSSLKTTFISSVAAYAQITEQTTSTSASLIIHQVNAPLLLTLDVHVAGVHSLNLDFHYAKKKLLY